MLNGHYPQYIKDPCIINQRSISELMEEGKILWEVITSDFVSWRYQHPAFQILQAWTTRRHWLNILKWRGSLKCVAGGGRRCRLNRKPFGEIIPENDYFLATLQIRPERLKTCDWDDARSSLSTSVWGRKSWQSEMGLFSASGGKAIILGD